MLNAYHSGSELADRGQRVAQLSNASADRAAFLDNLRAVAAESGEGAEAVRARLESAEEYGAGLVDEISNARRGMEGAATMLKSQFNFTVEVVQKDAAGRTAFQGFEVRHETYGLMTSVDAEGEITLYDGAGKGYAAATYGDINPDAFIPELHNDETRRAAAHAPVEEKLVRMHQRIAGQGFHIRR